MRLVLALIVVGTSALAETGTPHARLLAAYQEPDTWVNRANLYAGVRLGLSGIAGALSPSVDLELGLAPSFGLGFGVRASWMNLTPGAPIFRVWPGRYGFGAAAEGRFSFPVHKALTLYPSLSVGFVAGPDYFARRTEVTPLITPGLGARIRSGYYYGTIELGLVSLSTVMLTLGVGYQADHRAERAEAWAQEQERELEESPELQQVERLVAQPSAAGEIEAGGEGQLAVPTPETND